MELAQKIITLTGSSSQIVFKPLPENDPKRRQPDLSLARERLAYSPKVGWEEGLTKTIAYFQETLGLATDPGLARNIAMDRAIAAA